VEKKPMSSILFGSKVEFEMAILTMALLVSLHTHTWIQRNTCMHARKRERKKVYWRLLDRVLDDGCKCLDVAPSFISHPLPFLSLCLSCSWQGEPAFQMGSEKMVIKCFKQKRKGGDKIATAYMEIA
jgi:hypothetical protein